MVEVHWQAVMFCNVAITPFREWRSLLFASGDHPFLGMAITPLSFVVLQPRDNQI